MVVCQALDHRVQRDQPCCGDDARLAHTTARRLVTNDLPVETIAGGERDLDRLLADSPHNGPIVINGSESMAISFARCCHPLPGDPVIGHLSIGKGIVVHRHECGNLDELRDDPDKLVSLTWSKQIDQDFPDFGPYIEQIMSMQ